jgi:hypothetical protein
MGHASVTITLDRYGHLFPGAHAVTADRLDAYLERASHPPPGWMTSATSPWRRSCGSEKRTKQSYTRVSGIRWVPPIQSRRPISGA